MDPRIISQREKQVLELIAYENTNDQIAQQLYISHETVKTHRRNLLDKLSVKNTAGLVRRSFELGILQIGQLGDDQKSEGSRWLFGKQQLIRAASALVLLISCFSCQLKAQNNDINLIFLQDKIVGNLVDVPGFVGGNGGFYPTSWNGGLDVNTFPFYNWVKAESYGTYSTKLNITLKIDHPDQNNDAVLVQVLYHKNFGTPQQETKEIARFGTVLFYAGTPTEESYSINLDLDSLDGTQMGVIEPIYKVNGAQLANAEIPMVVSGLVTRDVQATGSMVTPQIPYLILHDPPGDNSSSTFEGGNMICRETNTTYQEVIGGGFTATGKVGLAGSIGVVLEQGFEFSVAITQDFKMTHSNLTETTDKRCIEITNSFSTSDLPGAQGEDADLFIGYGETWIYGIFEEIIVPTPNEVLSGEDTARVYNGLAYARDGSPGATTTFVKTALALEADIQTQLDIANNMSNSLLVRTRAVNQVKVWQDVLALNANNVANASEQFGNNYNFSGGGSSASFTEKITTTHVTGMTYDVAIEAGTSINFVAIVGANGFTGGPQFTFNKNEGVTTTNTNENSRLVGYTLTDDDDLDNFPISVFRDPSYGTPIFRLNNGARTSCPYEGGYRRDQPLITSLDSCTNLATTTQYLQTVNLNDPVNMRLDICNESDEERQYYLELPVNTNNAVVTVNGEVLGGINNTIAYTVPANSCWEDSNNEKPLVTIQRGPNTNVDQVNLVFLLYPACPAITGDNKQKGEGKEMTLDITFGKANPLGDEDCDGFVNVDPDGDLLLNDVDLCDNNRDAALAFDGIDDRVQVPSFTALDDLNNANFSISAWVFPTDSSRHTIVSKGQGGSANTSFTLSILDYFNPFNPSQQNGTLDLYIGNGTNAYRFFAPNSIKVPINEWSHVAVSFIGGGSSTTITSEARFWINGVFQGTSDGHNLPSPYSDPNDPLWIGRLAAECLNCSYFTGKMDELTFWSRALQQSEVSTIMNLQPDTTDANIVAYYNFNDAYACLNNAANVILADHGPNNANGTLENFSLQSGCNSNWTSGSNKITNCTACIPTLELSASTGMLDGIYSAQNRIHVMPGTQFGVGKTITLSAPIVDIDQNNSVPATTILAISQDGCQD